MFARDNRVGFSRSTQNAAGVASVAIMGDEIRQIEAPSRAEFRKWLEDNHATEEAVWLVLWKKGSGRPSVDWSDAVDEALCFGWIDSKVQSIDENRYRQYWTVRKPGSVWSRINKEKVAELTAAGLMAPAGLAAVARAKTDGSWTILDGPEAGIVPDDLATAMNRAGVRPTYDSFTFGARKAILAWLVTAKRDTTRADRIDKTVEALGRGQSPL